MNRELNINNATFNEYLKKQQKVIEYNIKQDTNIDKSCIELKTAIEKCIHNMVTDNKPKSSANFIQDELVSFKECGLHNTIDKLKCQVYEKTNLKLNVEHVHHVEYYFYPNFYEGRVEIELKK